MHKLLTGDVWKQINPMLTKKSQTTACIAYITRGGLKLSKGDILICDASIKAVKTGQTSAKILHRYFDKGIAIFSVAGLHAKLVFNDDIAVFGSANLSANSAERLTEAACVSNQKGLISQAKAFCENLKKETHALSETELAALLCLRVAKGVSYNPPQTKTRSKKFGSQSWFVTVHPLSERTEKVLEPKTIKATSRIAAQQGIEEDNVSFIHYYAESNFARQVKPGDRIIERFANKSNTRVTVSPPHSVLEKEKHGRFVLVYTSVES